MISKSFSSLPQLLLCVSLFGAHCIPCVCFEFDSNNFGVYFQPYVITEKVGELGMTIRSYTLENIVTMLSVVGSKFSNILVPSEFTYHDRYIRNFTYQSGGYPSVYSGEAAAVINRQKGNSSLKLLYHAVLPRTRLVAEARILLAFESAERANQIFPGTVKGISVSLATNWSEIHYILKLLLSFRDRASYHGVKLGAEINCFTLINPKNETIDHLQKQIVTALDYFICSAKASKSVMKSGPAASFKSISANLLTFRDFIWKINKNASVIGTTKWSSSGSETWETIENLRVYWEAASTWASAHKYTMYLREAFDNPTRQKRESWAKLGWWKIKDNSELNLLNGYVEKIFDNENILKDDPSTSEMWITNTGVALAVLVAAVITGAALILLVRFRLNRKPLTTSELRNFIFGVPLPVESVAAAGVENALHNPYDKVLEISRDDIKIENNQVLGIGQFGCVFRATLESNEGGSCQVAVKVARDNCSAIALNGLLSEIKILSYLGRHPNIVALKGAYTAELIRGVVYVVTELCSLGSLEKFLRKCQRDQSEGEWESSFTTGTETSISFNVMVSWSYEIACGMDYLQQKHVVHADLSARNVLLSCEKRAKIADFGLSRRMYNYMNYVKKSKEPLPWRWMALESLKRLEFSSKSDVWSYGVTLWEIFSMGDVPYPGQTCNQHFLNELASGVRADCPSFATSEIYQIMKECWALNPKERPDFKELLERCRGCIRNDQEEESLYLNLVDIV